MTNYNYLYDKDYFREEFAGEHFKNKKLSYRCYENAYIVPLKGTDTGVYTSKRELVEDSKLGNGNWEPKLKDEIIGGGYSNETVVYLGVIFPVWGHVITDVISMLWFLESRDYLEKYHDCKLVFANYYSEGEKGGNILELFGMLGVDSSRFTVLNETIQYKNVIVPDKCFYTDKDTQLVCFTDEYRTIIDKIRLAQRRCYKENKSFDKIYFSYAEYGKYKGNVGEEKLENFFAEQGYKVVYPEKYTLNEQLNMLANCHYFASTIGSCSHNVIFLPKYADVILIPRAYYLTKYQTALDEVVELNVSYIDSSLSVLVKNSTPTGGPFYYYVSENLRNFFGIDEPCDDKYYRKQLADYKKYMNNIVKYDDLNERYMPQYYCKQFAYCMYRLSRAHPRKRVLWLILLWAPDKIKRILKREC